MGTFTPELLKGLMAAHGFKNVAELARRSGVGHPQIYKFLNGQIATLSMGTRRKLAPCFPGNERLFVADIIDVEAAS